MFEEFSSSFMTQLNSIDAMKSEYGSESNHKGLESYNRKPALRCCTENLQDVLPEKRLLPTFQKHEVFCHQLRRETFEKKNLEIPSPSSKTMACKLKKNMIRKILQACLSRHN